MCRLLLREGTCFRELKFGLCPSKPRACLCPQVKLDWIQQTVLSLDPEDALLAPHMRPVLQGLYRNLHPLIATKPEMARTVRMVVHLVNSLISTCQ